MSKKQILRFLIRVLLLLAFVGIYLFLDTIDEKIFGFQLREHFSTLSILGHRAIWAVFGVILWQLVDL